MSKKFGKDIISQLQKIRYQLNEIQNCGDLEEAIANCSEMAADVDLIEDFICKKFKIYEYEANQ